VGWGGQPDHPQFRGLWQQIVHAALRPQLRPSHGGRGVS